MRHVDDRTGFTRDVRLLVVTTVTFLVLFVAAVLAWLVAH